MQTEVKARAGRLSVLTGASLVFFALAVCPIPAGAQGFARPNGTIVAGSWTPTPQYGQIDEVVPDDTDFTQVTGSSTLVVTMTPLGTVDPSTDRIIRFRIGAAAGNGGAQEKIDVHLYDGPALVAQTGAQTAPRGSWQTFEYTLTPAEVALITDYTQLRFYFVPTAQPADTVMVSWAEFEVAEPWTSISGSNYRSIGTYADILYEIGDASGTAGSNVVDLGGGASLPLPTAVPSVGPGDRLQLDPTGTNEIVYITSRVSATQVSVEGTLSNTHTNVAYRITRAYNSIGDWLADRSVGGRGGDLVGDDRREIGVAYKDSVFAENPVIELSTTDATHYRHLTVAPGQRHDGTAGTGVILDPALDAHAIEIIEDYFRLTYFEIRDWFGSGNQGIKLIGNHGFFNHLLVHDGLDNGTSGLYYSEPIVGQEVTIRNSIFYNVGQSGIWLGDASGTPTLVAVLDNVTVYNCGVQSADQFSSGVRIRSPGGGSTIVHATNVLSVGNFDGDGDGAADFVMGGGTPSWGTSDFNMSSDGSAPGAVVSSGTTAASGNTGVTVIGAAVDFVADGVTAGDWFNNDTDKTSSKILSVDGPTQLTLVETGVSNNSVSFSIGKSARYRLAANQFVAPGTDSHLKAGADAIDVGADLSSSFCCDIDSTIRPGGTAWDIGADEFGATTAVELERFAATPLDAEILLEWRTGSELDNMGCHLYRSTSEEGPYSRLTATLIPGLGSSPEGAEYSYRDSGLVNGTTYYYKLEDVDTHGVSEVHGPIVARPEEAAPSGDAEVTFVDDDAGCTRITFGDPTENALRVLEEGRGQLVLELETSGFYALPQDDGTVRFVIPDFLQVGDAPVPVRRSWIEAIAGRKVEIASVSAREVETFTGLTPSRAESSELVASANGTVRTRRRSNSSTRTIRSSARGEGWYPSEAARVVSVGFQGELKKALVELAPLRWDQTTGQLTLTRHLVVRLSLRAREPADSKGARGERLRTGRQRRGAVYARLATKDRGLYAVSFDDLFRRRRRALPASELRLSRQGEAVSYHLEPRSDPFGPGSTLYFLSDGADANPYGNETVYELELGREGAEMERADVSPAGDPVSYYWQTLRRERNRYYQPALIEAPDLWLWELVMAPGTKSFPFAVDNLVSTAGPLRLSVWLQGASDLGASPDHHVVLYVNGTVVGEARWDGKQPRKIDVELSPGVVVDGENILAIENVGDTSARYSMVMLDRFELLYPRAPKAGGRSIEGSWSEAGMAEVWGLETSSPLLVDTSETRPRWLEGAWLGDDGAVRFRAERGRRYLAVSSTAVLAPEIRRASSTGLASEHHRADYLVIAPDAFMPAVEPLLDLRRSQGLRVKAASMKAIYAEFGFGEETPEALRRFLSHAYHDWQSLPPRYVVLVGDATYDAKDHLGTGVVNRVPARIVKTSYLWTASDPSYAAVNGDDILPDFAIGRLPASTLAEAEVMVQKIVGYETGDAGLTRAPVVLVADNPDGAGNFVADAEQIAESLSPRTVEKIYLSELGSTATRDWILRAFDNGASTVSYLGHGGIHLWSSANVFNTRKVSSLSPQSQQPLLLTMNCLNGYFHFPYFDALSEALVKAEGRGAIAAFSPSGLSLNAPAHRYHQALLEELFQGRHARLGDAVLAAQERYIETGAFPELLTIYHLFGDPAMTLR